MAPPPLFLRVVYCIVIIAAVLPVGLASSSWVRLSLGGGGMGLLPLFSLLSLLLLATYRIVLVLKDASTLSAPPAAGVAKFLRVLGIVMLVVGAFVFALNIVAGPLMHRFMSSHTESGAEYFVAGMYLALLGGIGTFGLLLFEFSRLLGFEAAAGRAVS